MSGDGSIVVGYSHVTLGKQVAFIWDEPHGMRKLQDLLVELGVDLDGWELESAWEISDDGLAIVGAGINPSGQREGWIAVIPEPSTALLLGAGLGVLAMGRRH